MCSGLVPAGATDGLPVRWETREHGALPPRAGQKHSRSGGGHRNVFFTNFKYVWIGQIPLELWTGFRVGMWGTKERRFRGSPVGAVMAWSLWPLNWKSSLPPGSSYRTSDCGAGGGGGEGKNHGDLYLILMQEIDTNAGGACRRRGLGGRMRGCRYTDGGFGWDNGLGLGWGLAINFFSGRRGWGMAACLPTGRVGVWVIIRVWVGVG